MFRNKKEKLLDEIRLLIEDIRPELEKEFFQNNESESLMRHLHYSPCIDNIEELIVGDPHFQRCKKVLSEFELFKTHGGNRIFLDRKLVDVSPFSFVAVLLDYVISDFTNTGSLLGMTNTSADKLIEVADKRLKYGFYLLYEFITANEITYEAECIVSNVITEVDMFRLANCELVADDNIVLAKRVSRLKIEELLESNLKYRRTLPWWQADADDSFGELMGLLKIANPSVTFVPHKARFRLTFFGSMDSFVPNDALEKIERSAYRNVANGFSRVTSQLRITSEVASNLNTLWTTINDVGKSRERILSSMRRLAIAMRRSLGNTSDSIVDYITALEGLLVHDENHDNISYKIRLRTSVLLEGKYDSYDVIGKAYSVRSVILHTNKVDFGNGDNFELWRKLDFITSKAIMEFIKLAKSLGPHDDVIGHLDKLIIASARKTASQGQ